MIQIFLTSLFYLIFIAILIYIYKIWRLSSKRAQKMEETLAETAIKSSEAAKKAGEAALLLAEYLSKYQHAEDIPKDSG